MHFLSWGLARAVFDFYSLLKGIFLCSVPKLPCPILSKATVDWSFLTRNIWWSSAYIDKLNLTKKDKSFWKIFHISGPRAEPWGQPRLIVLDELVWLAILTWYFWSHRYLFKSCIMPSWKPYAFSLLSNSGGWRESNGLDISVNKKATVSLLSLARFHSSRFIKLVSQLWGFL